VEKTFGHRPVLLSEALTALALQTDGRYLDATFGRGGHARAMLGELGPQAKLWVLDRDPQAIEVARSWAAAEPRVTVLEGNFAGLEQQLEPASLDGVLFDFGVSSPQLDDAERGFSFGRDGPLDMRMDPRQELSAASFLASVTEMELARVLSEYGEERKARLIARALVQSRVEQPLTRTLDLAARVAKVVGYAGDKHPATRTFQALRMAVNQELPSIESALKAALRCLKPGGRLAAISFHSLEDRMVKQFMQVLAKAPANDRRRPPLPFSAQLRLVGKAVFASDAEVRSNPRSRSAVLRVAEKL